jgi:hypothetical protein
MKTKFEVVRKQTKKGLVYYRIEKKYFLFGLIPIYKRSKLGVDEIDNGWNDIYLTKGELAFHLKADAEKFLISNN